MYSFKDLAYYLYITSSVEWKKNVEGIKPWLPLRIFQSKLGIRLHLREKHDVRQTRAKEGYELVVLRLCFSILSPKVYF